LLIQGVGVLTNEPDFIDITGKDLSIAGQFDFLTHGTLESLVLYLSPTGQSFEINPYGILPVIFSVAFAALIVWRMWCKETGLNISPRLGWSLLALVLLVEFGTSIAWILAPYSQVLVAKANTKFVAANVFLADGRVCEASAMYRIALERSTAYQQQALVRLNQLDLQPGGIPITAGDMLAEEERLGSAIIEEDRATTVTGDGSLMATAAVRQDVIVRGHSNALPAGSRQKTYMATDSGP
jgi:hypothetical protein